MIYPEIPVKALSIRQPWASLIIYDAKSVENRSRRTHFRGEIAIHASLMVERDVAEDIEKGRHPVTGEAFVSNACGRRLHRIVGGIIGVAEIVDCVDDHHSDWFFGPYGYVLLNARPVEFIPVKGALGLFDWRRMMKAA